MRRFIHTTVIIVWFWWPDSW